MLNLHKLSLRKSLLVLTMLTSGVGLVLVCAGFLIYDLHDYRVKKVDELISIADLLGANSNAALAFDDGAAGTQLLGTLRTRPRIRAAVLYREDGRIFVSYCRKDLAGKCQIPSRPPDGVVWSRDALSNSQPVLLDKKPIGRLFLEEDLADMQARMIHFGWTSIVMALACLLLVYLLTARLRKTIARPIYDLAWVARIVAAGKNYSLRAPPLASEELGQLSADFNHMLDEIERRDAALREARDNLESRVMERTHELEGEIRHRQSAEDILRERTTLLNALITASPIAVVIETPDGRVEMTNPAFGQLFGYERDEVAGQVLDQLIASGTLLEQAGDFRRRAIKGETIHSTAQRRRKDGQLVDVEIHGVPLDVDGVHRGQFALYQDISERVRAEKDLRDSRELFRTLSEAAPVGIFRTDEKGMNLYVNKCWQEMTGVTAEEALGKGWRKTLHPEDRERIAAEWGDAAKNRTMFAASFRYLARNGNVVWVETIAQAMLDRSGSPLGFVGVVKDVTERHTAEEALRETEARKSAIIQSALDCIITIDAKGHITEFNPAAEKTFGHTREKVLGKELAETIIPPSLRDAHRRGMARYLATGEAPVLGKRIEVPAMRSDGREFPAELAIIRIGDTATPTFTAFLRDISERKQAESDLRKAKEAADAASRAKSEFLANMSHEIRTPMNGILGMTELALGTELSSEQREYLEMAQSSAEALLDIINDILDFSKIEAGKIELERVPFSLHGCIEDALQPLVVRAQQKGLELGWEVDPAAPEELVGDPTRLRQVLLNLVGNGVKFTKQGEVTITAELAQSNPEEVAIRFTVADTGIGIPPEKQKQIFESFSQADTSTTREYGGTGLGLSISSGLVSLMGGGIQVESEPGKGSRFFFTARFGRAGEKKETISRMPSAGSLAGKRVLCVDDSPINRRLLEQVLTQWNMDVCLAANGSEALELFHEAERKGKPFDVCVLDFQMPEMDGIQLATRLRQAAASRPPVLLLLSSSTCPINREELQRLGIQRVLLKPIRMHALCEAVTDTIQAGGATARVEAPVPAGEPRSGLRILLSEDNRVNQTLAVRMLEKNGHTVAVADNGREAVERSAQHRFDLVLMDVQMPVMGGFEATKLIRKREHGTGAHLPIVAMTAHAMMGDKEKCLAAGMDGYISKPIRAGEIEAEMKRVLEAMGPAGRGTASQAVSVAAEELLVRLDGDRALLAELLEMFREDYPTQIQAMRVALAQGAAEDLQRVGHTLKGTLANLAALPGRDLAGQIEEMGRNNDLEVAGSVASELERELCRVEAALEHLCQGVPVEDTHRR